MDTILKRGLISMWLDDLGVELTKIDRELLAFIRAVDSRKKPSSMIL